MRKAACLTAISWILSPAVATATVHSGTINADEAQATTCAVGSTTQAVGTVTYDDGINLFSWSYTYGDNAPNFDNGALFSGGTESASHFHGPALPGVPAGVQVGTGTGNPNSGSATISVAQGTDLLDELWYLNIHSSTCGGGEIRGQVLFPPPPMGLPSISSAGVAALVLCLLGAAALAVHRSRASTA